MKLKHLESALSSIQREFPSPKVELEQYPTSAHLAAWVGLTCLQNEDIGPHRSCMDLGCGTGMLALSCALLETDLVIAVDCDEEALDVAKQNCISILGDDTDEEESGTSHVEFVLAKINAPTATRAEPQQQQRQQPHPSRSKGGRGRGHGGGKGRGGRNQHHGAAQHQQYQHAAPMLLLTLHASDENPYEDGLPFSSSCVDTVITNPPFGTKDNAGMDLQFLRTAIRLARRAVYSFHKTSTRPFLIKTCQAWGLQVQVVAAMKFDIPQVYEFHKRKSVDVEVDLIRVELPPASPDNCIERIHVNNANNIQNDTSEEEDDQVS